VSFVTGISGGTDHQSCWFHIAALQSVTISERKQMVVFGDFLVDGDLIIDGQLILEP